MKLWQAVPVSLMLILGVNAVQAANNSSNKNSNQDSNNGVLTGDTRLSCEAILCLSTGTRPNECALSLKRYFSINAKHMSDTIRKRKNFLKLCPSSNEQGMPSLVDALANGAGRCDAAELNRLGKRTYKVKVCIPVKDDKNKFFPHHQKPKQECKTVTKTYIANTKPSYCSAYFNHGWTDNANSVRYIGVEKENGKWVNVQQ